MRQTGLGLLQLSTPPFREISVPWMLLVICLVLPSAIVGFQGRTVLERLLTGNTCRTFFSVGGGFERKCQGGDFAVDLGDDYHGERQSHGPGDDNAMFLFPLHTATPPYCQANFAHNFDTPQTRGQLSHVLRGGTVSLHV